MSNEQDASQDIQQKVLQETLSGLSSKDGSNTAAETCCVICLSEISEACAARPCLHRNFDFMCLASWLSLKPTCPLCKAEISEIHYDFANEGQSYKTYKVPKIGLEPARAAGGPEAPASNTNNNHLRSFRGRPRQGGSYRGHTTHVATPHAAGPEDRVRGVVERRRHVYRNRLYSLHVGSSSASRYRDISPVLFTTDPDLVSRARAWIRRELQVFEFLHVNDDSGGDPEDGRSEGGRRRRQNNAEFVLEYVIAVLKTVDIQASSGHAEELLRDFLGRDNTSVFLHELRSFLRSPYSVEAWDRHVQYDEARACPRPRNNEGTGGDATETGRPRPMADRYRPSKERPRDRGAPYSRRQRPHVRARDRWGPDQGG